MSRHSARSRLLGWSLAAAGLIAAASPASAQNSGCGDIQPRLQERKAIVEKLQALGKKMDPKAACTVFGQLANNGVGLVKWIDANKEWCQVPLAFAEGMKADHTRAMTMRGKACGVAAQQVQMEKKAKEQAQGGGGGLLGGNGLEGQYRMPQGAL